MDWVRQVEGFAPDNTDPGEPLRWEKPVRERREFGMAGWLDARAAEREAQIAEGECPLRGCAGKLDEAFNCNGCGVTSLPAVVEVPAVTAFAPTNRPFPELLDDEYAPAQLLDEDAA